MSLNLFLPSGQKVKLDRQDNKLISKYRWYFANGYAKADNPYGKGKGRSRIYMHRLILGAQKGLEVDHINGNRLDNRRRNLRVCSRRENARNASGVKGISWLPKRREWLAQITVDYKHIALGYFKTAAEACAAYRTGSKLLHGEYASTARKNLYVA